MIDKPVIEKTNVRPACEKDAVSVCRLMEILEEKRLPGQIFRERFARFIGKSGYIALVYDEGGVKGFLSARYEETLHREGLCAEILDICVDPACRSRGVGAVMLTEAEKLLWQAGAEMIKVSSGTGRTDAHRFYLKNGYETDHINFRKYRQNEQDLKE
ncbi:MAG: hypothetical protein CW338_04885 [Clostridiales bacterium]|nr:hypothetical protein [Clostridiales bacterium]